MTAHRTGLDRDCDASLPDTLSEHVLQLFGPQDPCVEEALSRSITELAGRFASVQRVSTDAHPAILAQQFGGAPGPDEPLDIPEYLAYLDEAVLEHSTHTASPRCLALMSPPVPFFMPHLARLVTALNQNLVRADASKAFTPFERATLAMLHRLVFDRSDAFYAEHAQEPNSTLGLVLSGATLANIAGLWCARNACLAGVAGNGAGAGPQGLGAALSHHEYVDAVIIASASVHYSIPKAADLLGIGRHHVILVPTDERDRIDVGALRRTIRECQDRHRCIIALVCVAGSTETGSIDPLEEVAAVAEEHAIHLHVDAAWGGPVLFSRRYRGVLRGIERADSVSLDGHKQLCTPNGTGVLLFRNPAVAHAIEHQAQYIIRRGSLDLGNRSLEGSRAASVLFLHAGLHLIGRSGYEWLIEHGLEQARYAVAAIRARREFELLLEPELNIVLYRYVPKRFADAVRLRAVDQEQTSALNDVNEWLHARQSAAGQSLVSRTLVRRLRSDASEPVLALRAVFANPLTTTRDIDAMLDEQIALAAHCPS